MGGFTPVVPGVDSLTALRVSGETSPYPGSPYNVIDNVGLNPDPFPTTDDPAFDPLNSDAGPNIEDTVLRTAPILLHVAKAGTVVNQTDAGIEGTRGVDGSENIVLGKSGGQANLFGNIPGSDSAIDVTVSFEGKINSILRTVDSDFAPAISGQKYPPSSFECRQILTGTVQNYFLGINLSGSLQIAPAITKDGRLRIARAQLSAPEYDIAVAACLYPHSYYAGEANNSDTTTPVVPNLPVAPATRHPVPNVPCQSPPTDAIKTLGVGAENLTTLTGGGTGGYTTNADGSRVSVEAVLTVDNVSADILIGKGQG